jgi:hypothetical protein
MLGRKLSVAGDHSLLATDFGDETGSETEEQDWMSKYVFLLKNVKITFCHDFPILVSS